MVIAKCGTLQQFAKLVYHTSARKSIHKMTGGDMMVVDLKDNLVRVIILDLSGIYAQIHNQGYFDKESVTEIRKQYSDIKLWHVLVIDG